MTKRERMIAIALGTVVGGAVLYKIGVEPLMNSRADLTEQISHTKDDLFRATRLISAKPTYDRAWNDNLDQGLTYDASASQSLLFDRLTAWVGQARLSLANLAPAGTPQTVLKPGGKVGEKEKGFMRITFRLAASGSMGQIVELIRNIQTADIPVRINEMSLSSDGNNGSNELKVSLGVSTIFLVPDTKPGEAAIAPATRPSTRAGVAQGQQFGRGTNASAPTTGPTTRRENR